MRFTRGDSRKKNRKGHVTGIKRVLKNTEMLARADHRYLEIYGRLGGKVAGSSVQVEMALTFAYDFVADIPSARTLSAGKTSFYL